MTARAETPPAVPCYERLAELLAESRPDTTAADWRGAMLAAQTVGWRWEDVLFQCALALKHGDGPHALRDAVRFQPKPRPPREERP